MSQSTLGLSDRALNARIRLAFFFAGFATFSLLYCVQPILPVFSAAFAVDAAASALALSLTTGALALAVCLAAPISEKFGRKRIMAASMMTAAALNTCVAIAPDWTTLLVLRGLEGVALGGLPAVAMAYLADEVEPGDLGLSMGLYIAGSAFGGISGRLGAGLLTDLLGWREALGVIGLLGVATAALFTVVLPAPRRHLAGGGLAPAVHLLAWRRHLATPGMLQLYAVGFALLGSFSALYSFAAFRLTAPPFSFDQAALGVFLSVYIVGIPASSIAGYLADRVGRQRVLPLAIGLAAVGAVVALSAEIWLMAIGVGLLTLGFFAAHTVASSWVGRLAQGARGHAAALYLLAYYAGSTVGGVAAGWGWIAFEWPGVIGVILGLLALGGGAASRVHSLSAHLT